MGARCRALGRDRTSSPPQQRPLRLARSKSSVASALAATLLAVAAAAVAAAAARCGPDASTSDDPPRVPATTTASSGSSSSGSAASSSVHYSAPGLPSLHRRRLLNGNAKFRRVGGPSYRYRSCGTLGTCAAAKHVGRVLHAAPLPPAASLRQCPQPLPLPLLLLLPLPLPRAAAA